MSERGFIAIDRGIFEHPFFAREPFTEREAWVWMIAEAAWRPCQVRIGRTKIDLDRGQLAFSTRFVAIRWRWSESRVRRFLKRIGPETNRRTGDALASTLATRDATVVTICNYEKWQSLRRTGDAQTDAPPDAKATQRRTNNQEPDISPSLRSGETRARPGCRLAADWMPDSEDLAFARTLLPDQNITTERDRFRDHWHSANGATAVKRDWSAAWRNWCRRAADMQRSTGPPRPRPNGSFASMLAEDLRAAHEQPDDDLEPSFDLGTGR